MDHHFVSLAVDLLFTGPVKMELFQGVLLVAHPDGTSGRIVDHDRMTVINDVQRGRLVVEPNGRQVGLLWITNVNGGLVVSVFAGSEIRVQVTPVTGTLVSVVAPVGGLMYLGVRKRGR